MRTNTTSENLNIMPNLLAPTYKHKTGIKKYQEKNQDLKEKQAKRGLTCFFIIKKIKSKLILLCWKM